MINEWRCLNWNGECNQKVVSTYRINKSIFYNSVLYFLCLIFEYELLNVSVNHFLLTKVNVADSILRGLSVNNIEY